MSTIAALYVALAERVAARLGSPRLRALHLPSTPDAAVEDPRFCAAELEDGSIGFSFVLGDAVEPLLRAHRAAGGFGGVEAAALARGFAAGDPGGKALGFAAINALSQSLFARAHWVPAAAGSSLGAIEPRCGEHVGMIGLFPPLVADVKEAGARLTVLELRPELAGEHADYRVTLDPAALATCDQVISTCTVMLNDTLDAVLAACRRARHFAIVGPTAGCLPDPLFARGVDSVGGRRVLDAAGFLRAFRSGEKWGSCAGKYVIARQDYPGLDWLLERAGA